MDSELCEDGHQEERSGRLEVQRKEQRAASVPRGAVPATSTELCCFTATGSSAQISRQTLAGVRVVTAHRSKTLFIGEGLREHCCFHSLVLPNQDLFGLGCHVRGE